MSWLDKVVNSSVQFYNRVFIPLKRTCLSVCIDNVMFRPALARRLMSVTISSEYCDDSIVTVSARSVCV